MTDTARRVLPAVAPAQVTPSPAQALTIDTAARAMTASELVVISGERGTGRSLVLRELQRRHGGRILDATDLMTLTKGRSARRYEQSLFELIRDAFADHRIVYLDDASGFQEADRHGAYNRRGQISAMLRALRDIAARDDRRLVAATDLLESGERMTLLASGSSWDDKGIVVRIPALGQQDYAHILAAQLGTTRAAGIDSARLFAGSRRLNAKTLVLLARILQSRGIAHPTAEDALDILDRDIQHGNVDLGDVEAISMESLIGVDAIVRRLDRAILLPLREPALARELQLEPKHGVLIHGPPGTGKTTIGRALAHMMRGRFFMIDGDFVHDGPGFQAMVDAVFDAAVRSSPSVIFVDDADVIMNDHDMQHFGRYLLTRLDGLQSESLANVCVVMTAMNIASMPPALLRSGRLEVWLEMSLPDAQARIDLLHRYAARLPFPAAKQAAHEHGTALSMAADSFTPADLRRVVGDAAGRLAFDRHRARAEQPFDRYLALSIAEVAAQKAMAETAIGTRGGMRFH